MSRAFLALATAALVAPALAGCIAAPVDTAGLPADIERLVSQVLYPDVIAEHHLIPSFDGTIIDAWVFRPDTSETNELVPVIINFSPYWSNLAPPAAVGGDAFSLYLIDYYVPRGYAAALVSARGTGLSEGCFTIGGPLEIADEDVVATYLATQPWANGNVTASGKSYDGTMAQGLITTGNPHVKTIAPVAPISELYKYNYFHGVPYSFHGQAFNPYYVGIVSLAQDTDPRGETWTKTPTRFCDESVGVQTNQYHTMALGDYTPYWQARNYTALLPEDVPSVFYIHGLQDWNVKPDHMVPWIDELRARGVPVKMWLGQWKHDYPTRDDWNMTMLRWFDHFLKGIDTGILQEPLVQVQDNTGVWRNEADWPATRAQRTHFYTDASGALATDAAGSGTSSYPDRPSLPLPGVDASVRFSTEPMARAMRLVGEPILTALVSSTGPRATLSAALLLDGKVIDQGFLDLAHRDGLEAATPMTPGAQYPVTVRFFPQDVLIPEGSVLTLVVSHTSGGGPVAVVPIPTASVVALHHGEGTYLDLPLVAADDVTLETRQPQDVGCWAC